MADGKAILSTDAAAHAAENAYSVLEEPVCSMISAPLMGPSHKPLGLIHIDTTDADRQFTEEDLEVLVSVATVAGQAVEHAKVHEAAMLLDRRQRELAMAQQVQLHFLPQQPPDLPGYRFLQLLSRGGGHRRRLFRLHPAGRRPAGDGLGRRIGQGRFGRAAHGPALRRSALLSWPRRKRRSRRSTG